MACVAYSFEPAPVMDVENYGMDCWQGYACGGTQGPCAWCGPDGYCCKKGWTGNGCDGTMGIAGSGHDCVGPAEYASTCYLYAAASAWGSVAGAGVTCGAHAWRAADITHAQGGADTGHYCYVRADRGALRVRVGNCTGAVGTLTPGDRGPHFFADVTANGGTSKIRY